MDFETLRYEERTPPLREEHIVDEDWRVGVWRHRHGYRRLLDPAKEWKVFGPVVRRVVDAPEIDPSLAYPPECNVEQAELICDVREAMLLLPPRLWEVLRMRFGIASGVEMTTHEIGEALGISRSRVSQMEAKAMRLMRRVVDLRVHL